MGAIDKIVIETFELDDDTASFIRLEEYDPDYNDEEVEVYMRIESIKNPAIVCLTEKQAEALAKGLLLMLEMNKL